MSQRNVNLRSFNYGQQSQKIIDRSYLASANLINNIAKQQEEDRKRNEEAMLLGDATAEQLTLEYSKQLKDASAETKTALTAYAREQAQLIGDAKTKAYSPGATQADKDYYLQTLSQGTSNLEALATYSTLAAKDLNTYKQHVKAVRNGSSEYSLTRDARLSPGIKFNSVLSSAYASNIKVTNNENGQAVLSFTGKDGELFEQNIHAQNQAFKQTGYTIQSEVIKNEDLITNKDNLALLEEQIGKFGDIGMDVEFEREVIDLNSNTKKIQTVKQKNNIADDLFTKHNDYLLQKTKSTSFNKSWDQLYNLGYLNDPYKQKKEGKYANISWSTFNQDNVSAAVEQLNNSGAFKDLAGSDEKFTEEEYLQIQGEIRQYAARAYANFAEANFGQQTSEVTDTQVFMKIGGEGDKEKLADYTEIYNASNTIKETSSRLKDFNVGPASLQPFVKGIGLKGLMERDIDKLDEKSKQIRLDLEKNIKIGEKFANNYNGRVHVLEGSRSAIIDVNNKENPVIQVTEQGLVFNIYDDKGNVKIQYDLSDPNQIITFENNLIDQDTGVIFNDKTSALNTLTN
tara:strand:+ start:3053 stop:4765 length:1713 start_codon:yes stop_codon:yes gene_type:complete